MNRQGALAWLLTLAAVSLPVWAQQPMTGVIKPFDDIKLSLPVAGRIEAVLVKEGQTVKKGAVILTLDKSLEALEVDRRRLLLQDTAKLQESIQREQTLREQVAHARELMKTNTISRKQLEDEELAYRTALADRQALESAKKREQVEYDLAREALSRRFLRAPIDGQIVKLNFQVGESAGVHEPLARLVDTSKVRFTGNVPADQATHLKSGQSLRVRFGADSSAVVRQGKITFISPVADLASGLVEVKVEFPNTGDAAVRPGIVGEILLSGADKASH